MNNDLRHFNYSMSGVGDARLKLPLQNQCWGELAKFMLDIEI